MSDLYGDVLAGRAGRAEHAVPRLAIHQAARRALGMEPLPGATEPAVAEPAQRRTTARRLLRLFRG
jgi:hypothetical protein